MMSVAERPVRVVVLGGSGVATPALAEAIVAHPGRTQAIDLVLVGRSAEKLRLVADVFAMIVDRDALLSVSASTDAAAALAGADYVINQIRVGGLEARAFDETFPHEFDLPGEETVGPGGFANASRTIPVVLEYVRLMERICPDATLLTFVNPSSLIHYAITRYTKMRAIGLCDSPVSLVKSIASAIGAPEEELIVDYAGMHHFGWVYGVTWRGRDVLPQVLDKAPEIAKDVDSAIVRAVGALPGAYLNYVFHPDRMLARKRGKRARAEELLELQDEILDDYRASLARGERPSVFVRRRARWYGAIIVPVLAALIEGSAGSSSVSRFILNVVNGRTVPWLPQDAIVEVPAIVAGGQVRPLSVGDVPADVQALIQSNCAYEMLAVQAIVERDRDKALRALLANPIVHTYDQAAGVLDRVWHDNS
jgi:6-phospho-beta-glucosidase